MEIGMRMECGRNGNGDWVWMEIGKKDEDGEETGWRMDGMGKGWG